MATETVMPRYLDPKSDVVFKKIFGQHPRLLKSFLNAVLPLPVDGLIENLEYLAFEQIPVIPTFKHTIVDVKCTDQQGRIFIVEMQIQWVPSFMQRMLFGASQAYVRQLEKGEKYEYLNPVYGLGILATAFDHDTED
jgi:predicted transposase/invertase (TIGR01784 family)